MSLTNTPQFIVTAPACCACAGVWYGPGVLPGLMTQNRLLKLTLPITSPIGGMMRSETSACTMAVNAPPTAMPHRHVQDVAAHHEGVEIGKEFAHVRVLGWGASRGPSKFKSRSHGHRPAHRSFCANRSNARASGAIPAWHRVPPSIAAEIFSQPRKIVARVARSQAIALSTTCCASSRIVCRCLSPRKLSA